MPRFFIPLTLLALWLIAGQKILSVLNPENKNRRALESQIETIRSHNPEADAFFAQLKDDRDRAALAATIRAAAEPHGEASALRSIADEIGRSESPAIYRLARIAADLQAAPSSTERDAILYTHGTTLQALLGAGEESSAADQYLDQLETAVADPDLWSQVRDDPIGLLIAPHLQQQDGLWEFYLAEREWLGDLLGTAAPVQEDGATTNVAGAEFLVDLVRIAQQNHPQVKAATAEFGLVALPLFDRYGEILSATSALGVPDSETLEVIFANQDQFANDPPDADQLIHLKKNHPAVWEAARLGPLVLRLHSEAPHLSESLLKQFPHADIAAFLYTNYEEQIPAAAAALEKFGDLGLYILNRYAADERTADLLADPLVGPRAIPFLARFGDQGFEKLEDDLGWLDRYFDAAGNPIDGHGWIEGIPIVGAPANVIQHWVKGNPVSWGELGWAGLDVVDGALLVASFGASAPVTAAKQGAKTTGRQAVKTTTRKSAQRHVTRATARNAVAKRSSLLRKFAARNRWATPLAGGTELIFRIGRTTTSRIGASARQAASKLKTTWSASPLRVRKWTYRGLLAVGLYFTISERTLPNLPTIAEGVGAQLGKIANSVTEAIPTALAAALREWFEIGTASAANTAYTITALLLAAASGFLFFRSRKKIRRI